MKNFIKFQNSKIIKRKKNFKTFQYLKNFKKIHNFHKISKSSKNFKIRKFSESIKNSSFHKNSKFLYLSNIITLGFISLFFYWPEAIHVTFHFLTYWLAKRNLCTLCKFRTTKHKLPIETGRWYGIDRENRQCLKCNSRSIGDKFNYIMECHFFYWKSNPTNK